jgi:(4S)-4-hydroxy-5-phosphonooxypentane-2,3-dione isomerase
MQALIVEFHIEPAFVDAFAQAIADNARSSLQHEPGCRRFDICRDPQEAQLFFLYELYDDEEAVQAHLQSPHFLSFAQATAPWVRSKRVRRMERNSGVEP